MIFYHVDRSNSLKEGQVVTLTKDFRKYPDSYKNVILKLYPEGLSYHGLMYAILSFEDTDVRSSQEIETIFEFYRQIYFVNKISRFQSFFCFQTLTEAKKFAKINSEGYPDYKIYEVKVDHDNYFIGDMNLLRGNTAINSYMASHDYWSGGHSCNPIFEVLVKPPLKILDIVYSEKRKEQI